MTWLAYAHPLVMICTVALAIWVLRLGLGIRRARLRRRPHDSRRHRAAARVLALLVALGAGSGLASMAWLRSERVADSVHFRFALLAALAMSGAGLLGLWLERGAPLSARDAHAAVGALTVLAALGAAMAGLALLP